ncbi:MAG: hypothetical protein KAY82_06515, partial [Hylemonella sp.]|nr:hypothetical protein [Hylemonella sp.]
LWCTSSSASAYPALRVMCSKKSRLFADMRSQADRLVCALSHEWALSTLGQPSGGLVVHVRDACFTFSTSENFQ